jgi:alginate O-acetyltransferase complex protein AlgI
MLFNSLNYALFLPIVFLLYWYVVNKGYKIQNCILLISSYFFYACWDWRFLFLLIFSTFLDYLTGLKMSKSKNQKTKKAWFLTCIIINLGFLGLFKYYNFFVISFSELFLKLGIHVDQFTLNVILPVGISFYTFHGLSYIIDIYKGKIKAESSFLDYALFVCFFPLLVAGPIERATHLLPQLKKNRFFNEENAIDGLKQILWGLFKKIVLADNCAYFANMIFDNSGNYSGSTLVLGALLFTFQIYGDFSGYSDIAIGTARLFGIDLIRNFAFPYFSRDIAEFWRRWHISLSSWFRDYLYIPLGGSKGSIVRKILNILIIFLISGLWHGANWTFIIWGLLNALYIMPSIILKTNRKHLDIVAKGKMFASFREIVQIVITFALTVFAWIFFRCTSVHQAIQFVNSIFSYSLFSIPDSKIVTLTKPIFFLIFIFTIIEWLGREQSYAIEKLFCDKAFYIRWLFYYILICLIFIFAGSNQQFIYFQF